MNLGQNWDCCKNRLSDISAFQKMLDGSSELFDYGGRYHIETKSMDWFLYDNGLGHERVKKMWYMYATFRSSLLEVYVGKGENR